MNEDIMRQNYRQLTEEEKNQLALIKSVGSSFYHRLVDIGESRELSLAKTKIEEAVMWATKHITR